jgi:hypothetical protein
MNWTSLRRGSIRLHIAAGAWYSNNPFAHNSVKEVSKHYEG